MNSLCTLPGCFHLAAPPARTICVEHFLKDSYAQLNRFSNLLTHDNLDAFTLTDMKLKLYGIADQACVIACGESGILKIDQIRLLELEELAGKVMRWMAQSSANYRLPSYQPDSQHEIWLVH